MKSTLILESNDIGIYIFTGIAIVASMPTKDAGGISFHDAAPFTAYIYNNESFKMKDQKYRAFMVTPAFIKARERKERNDVSYGRVFPALEYNTLGNVDHRSIGKGLDERNTVISPRSIKVCSAPAPRTKGLDSVVGGHPGEPRLNGGNVCYAMLFN